MVTLKIEQWNNVNKFGNEINVFKQLQKLMGEIWLVYICCLANDWLLIFHLKVKLVPASVNNDRRIWHLFLQLTWQASIFPWSYPAQTMFPVISLGWYFFVLHSSLLMMGTVVENVLHCTINNVIIYILTLSILYSLAHFYQFALLGLSLHTCLTSPWLPSSLTCNLPEHLTVSTPFTDTAPASDDRLFSNIVASWEKIKNKYAKNW